MKKLLCILFLLPAMAGAQTKLLTQGGGTVTTGAGLKTAGNTLVADSSLLATKRYADSVARALAGTDGGTATSVKWDSITGKPSTFPPATHTHGMSDVSGLNAALAAKAPNSHQHGLGDLQQSGASSGQVIKWNGSAWAPATDATGGGGGSLPTGGTTGQVLTKQSNADGDAGWAPPQSADNSFPTRSAIAALTPLDLHTVYLTERGREGRFVFHAGDYSYQVSTDPRQAVFIAPAADADGSSGAWVRVYFGGVNVTWFGAVGDGVIDEINNTATGTDNTAAIQAGVDFLRDNHGGNLLFPAKVFVVSSPHNTANGSYAQISLPLLPGAADALAISFVGESAPVLSGLTNDGPMIVSPVNADYGMVISSVIGFEGGNGNARSWLSFYLDNLIVRTPQASHHSALDMRLAHIYSFGRFRFDIIGGIKNEIPDIQVPTFPLSYGVVGSKNNFPLYNSNTEGVIFGHYNGMLNGELTGARELTFSGCINAMVFDENYHSSSFDRIIVLSCVTSLKFNGPCHVKIGMLSTEHTPLPAGWPARGADIVDPYNLGHGPIYWHLHDGSRQLVVDGGLNLDLSTDKAGGTSYTKTFDGMESVTSRSGITETEELLPGRFPWHSLVSSKTGDNDGIGVVSFANIAGGGTDKRRAQLTAINDGNINDGALLIQAAKNASLSTIATFHGSGRVQLPGLASNLTPPSSSGTTKMVITDNAGMLSFADIPSGGGGGTSDVIGNSTTPGAVSFTIKNTNAAGDAKFAINNSDGNGIFAQVTGNSYPAPNLAAFYTTGGLARFSFLTNAEVSSGGNTAIAFTAGGVGNTPGLFVTAGNPGLVGIGTVNPQTRLDVAGDITVRGGIRADLLPEFTDDVAAANGGITIGQFYRTGSFVKQRIQ